MNDSPLITKSKAFALIVIRTCKELRAAKCESALIHQFLRSGTSIGANIREAFYAHSKADFIAKLQIALKECSETEYWIELLIESGYSSDTEILNKCIELKKILIASVNTAKKTAHDLPARPHRGRVFLLPPSRSRCTQPLRQLPARQAAHQRVETVGTHRQPAMRTRP